MHRVFRKLVPLLVKEIPRALRRLKLEEPINCVRMYYYDTHAPCMYLELAPITERHRQQVLEKKAEKAIEYLWYPGASTGDGPSACIGGMPSDAPFRIQWYFWRGYRLISDDDDGDLYLQQFREMLRQVARELNAKDWAGQFPATDDFVFVPADGSRAFAYEHDADYHDLKASVSSEQLERLRAKGLLGPDEFWEHRPGYDYSHLFGWRQ